LMEQGNPLEITTLRRDGDYLNHRHPQTVEFTRSLKEDLARRDFTVNAMAYAPHEGLTDPFGGAEDLKVGILRCVGHPLQRFDEDALRILRLVRFASQLSFQPEPETLAAASQLAPLLQKVSGERISAELNRLLLGEDVFLRPCVSLPITGFWRQSSRKSLSALEWSRRSLFIHWTGISLRR
jgi:tRNA nucleotidyltransferase (CCA-adding enzyme)